MKKPLVLTVIAALFTFVGNFAVAQQVTSDGNAWHKMCNSEDSSGKLICKAFITGFVSGQSIQANVVESKIFCAPENASATQLVDIFRLYLEKHPEQRHQTATTLAAFSMMNAFPCPKAPTSKKN